MFDFSRNYFELFGLPVDYRVDLGELSLRYRELQRVVHPDRFAAAGAHSQRLSLQSATFVNEAYAALKDPLKRAQYLLELKGAPAGEGNQTLNDPAFLMQQMELREVLAELRATDDPFARLDALLRDIDAMIKNETARLVVQFDDGGAAQLEAAASTIQKMQFLKKLQAEAEAVEAELEEAG
ncbi:MAG: Fe-S protein assembly co-chaperone HscB [Gammaproteobacteria bacterium]|nr:Fe-S protein assembly co-chaperone HscB [Gammaproteobacteria bacterium]